MGTPTLGLCMDCTIQQAEENAVITGLLRSANTYDSFMALEGAPNPMMGGDAIRKKRKKLKREGNIGESHGGVMDWFCLLLVNPTSCQGP